MPVLAIHAARPLQRRQRAPRRGLAQDVDRRSGPSSRTTRSRSSRSRTASTRRRGCRDEMGALFTRYLGPRWAEQPDDAELWAARRTRSPTPSSGQVHEHRRHRLVQLARRWLRAAAERRGGVARGDRRVRRGARPARAHHRLRAPLRDLQARDAPLHAISSASSGSSATPSGPVQLVFAGKAHPQDKRRQGAHSLDRPREPRRAACAGRVVFIEDYDMRIARALVSGRRRVAQHAAAPARGERDERHEGGRERRAQRERARRLVGRGVGATTAATSAGPSAAARSTPDGSGDARRGRAALRPARARGRPALLPARDGADRSCRARGSSG